MSNLISLAWARLPATSARQHPQLRVMAHALRDALIAQQTACPIADIQIERAHRSGKPRLLAPAGWHFNLSHSRDVAVVALGREPLGVDVEYLHRRANWPALAKRVFHAQEWAQLQALSAADLKIAALQLWTAKEAWSKALGLGIAGFADLPPLQWRNNAWHGPLGHGLVSKALDAELWFSLVVPGHSSLKLRMQRAELLWQGDGFVVRLPACETILE